MVTGGALFGYAVNNAIKARATKIGKIKVIKLAVDICQLCSCCYIDAISYSHHCALGAIIDRAPDCLRPVFIGDNQPLTGCVSQLVDK